MIPTWLQTHLENTGRWNVDGVARTISATSCKRCHAHILQGLDADHAALPAAVDPDPLTPAGEVAALLTGRRTYNLIRTAGNKWALHIRGHYQISAPRKHLVLAAHECGKPLGIPETQPPAFAAAIPDSPPF